MRVAQFIRLHTVPSTRLVSLTLLSLSCFFVANYVHEPFLLPMDNMQ